MWVQPCAFKILGLFLLQCSVFQNKPTLGQIIVIFQLDKATYNVINWKKC